MSEIAEAMMEVVHNTFVGCQFLARQQHAHARSCLCSFRAERAPPGNKVLAIFRKVEKPQVADGAASTEDGAGSMQTSSKNPSPLSESNVQY